MITEENLVMHELIGLDAKVVESTNKEIVGFEGKIIDETKFMFSLKTKNGIKNLPKENSMWKFNFGNKESVVNGNLLSKRPSERLGGKR